MLGISGLFGVDADGGSSSAIQPPLRKPDVDIMGGGGTVAA